MNTILKQLLDSGDVVNARTLKFTVEGRPSAYTTEYLMDSMLGPMKWWCTWKDPECRDDMDAKMASIRIHDARARLYFPAYLDTRIPPENREPKQLKEIMEHYGVKEYDKFDFIIATHAYSVIKRGEAYLCETMHCPYDEIHAIDEILREYQRTL